LPCGTGKTIIGCYFAKEYECVIIISPLKQFAEQNIKRFNQYTNEFISLLIDSDGTRNVDEIKQFLKNNKDKKILLSVTYKSVDILNKVIRVISKLKDIMLIVDEFHNLSKNNIYQEEIDEEYIEDEIVEINKNPLYELLKSDHKILFQSATPRIYELENTDLQDDYFEEIFGQIAHKMEFKEAIEKNT
jgi:superfamily II DNA or RNA helicase